MVGLGEGVGERGAAVAHRLGERVPAVQVAERGVVDAVEDRRRHQRDAADADVALGVAGLTRAPATKACASTTERVAAARAGEVGADAPHRLGQRRLVGAAGSPHGSRTASGSR